MWQGQFAPFGQELDAQTTTNRYKYTGLEFDSESQLDHATFRQYSPVSTRWMTADPFDGSIDASNPQSLNRYSYVNNMPFNCTDPSGLFPLGCGFSTQAGADGGWSVVFAGGAGASTFGIAIGVAEAASCLFTGIKDLLHLFYHPKFTASHVPRPGAHIWDEHGSYMAVPNNGIGDLLGLSGAGCELGVCNGGGFGLAVSSLKCNGVEGSVRVFHEVEVG